MDINRMDIEESKQWGWRAVWMALFGLFGAILIYWVSLLAELPPSRSRPIALAWCGLGWAVALAFGVAGWKSWSGKIVAALAFAILVFVAFYAVSYG